MKRYAIFLGVGPLIGYVLAIGEMFLLSMPPDFSWVGPGVIFAYVVGLIPAGIAALADSKWKNIVIGMISAAVCSWLSAEKSARRLNEKGARPTNERQQKV
jgi:hypothetical protein